ncbi:Rho GTPase-activating protein [Oopsacas minuta]|uniref:Rho GTPase-activating protein n=1 Tax=Oopsacas minuta TaxID=111878 RepID=A0AAV7JZL2_9METZ|nr:Rho GTPase-activating protein [Oopsacas minuta]
MAKNTPIVLSLSIVGKPSAGGDVGVGKSSLCNRLMRRDLDDFTPDKHKSTISQTDFVSPVINHKGLKRIYQIFEYSFEIYERMFVLIKKYWFHTV